MEFIIFILVLMISFGFWFWEKSKNDLRFKILFAMYVSFFLGIFGEILDTSLNLNLSGLGTILAVVTMGGFILQYSKK